jgi:DNA-binding NtrC family response regulator
MAARTILIVDDEPRALHSLYRSLRGLPGDWDIRCAASAADALVLLGQRPADVLLTDLYMPGMDGLQLLRQVRGTWPEMLRLAMSGYSDQEQAMQPEGLAHQFLRKPCLPEAVAAAIERGAFLRKGLPVGGVLSTHLTRARSQVERTGRPVDVPNLLDTLTLKTLELPRIAHPGEPGP